MAKTVQLKDGSEVLIRPLTKDDFELSLAFFRELPREDLDYLRGDPSQREVLERRFKEMESGEYDRLIALAGDRIVAEGTLEMTGRDWTSHVGELRLIVARDFQRKGLGMLMAHELYSLAARCKLEKIMVTLMRPQTAARNIFRKLGFREEMVLPDHVRDRSGKTQDLILMRCDLKALWKELDAFFGESAPGHVG
jgi:RimJ/RimL family protein N-acetyltransferase